VVYFISSYFWQITAIFAINSVRFKSHIFISAELEIKQTSHSTAQPAPIFKTPNFPCLVPLSDFTPRFLIPKIRDVTSQISVAIPNDIEFLFAKSLAFTKHSVPVAETGPALKWMSNRTDPDP